jgi:hypothetical protein
MIDKIRDLQTQLKKIHNEIKKIQSNQITHKKIKDKTKDIVDYYFRNIREDIVEKKLQNDEVKSIDLLMHTLLEATHKSSSINVYINSIKELKKLLIQLEKTLLLNPTYLSKTNYNDSIDQKIIDTLNKISTSASLSYKQAVIDLQSNNKFSWRGPATDLREALRECLDNLAPDKDVKEQDGFKLEPNTSVPTMKQKVRFILKQRDYNKNKIKPVEDAINIIEETISLFVRSVYTRVNISTHSSTNKSEVKRVYDFVKLIFCEILFIS